MKPRLGRLHAAAVLGAAVLGFAVAPARADMAPRPAVLAEAEAVGRALDAALRDSVTANTVPLRNFAALAQAVALQQCPDHEYRYVLLPDAAHATAVYVIAAVADRQSVVIGRHFRAAVVGGAADLGTLTASTRGCVVIPPPADHDLKPVGLYVTHLLTATPTEYHVLQTLLHPLPLTVEAGGKRWLVRDGRIDVVPAAAPDGNGKP